MITLKEYYENEKNQEKVIVNLANAENESDIISFLWTKNLVFGTYEIDKRSIPAAKQYFYNCGRLDMMGVLKYNDRIFDYGLSHICLALLSDSPELINRYAELRYKGDGKNFGDMDSLVAEGELPVWSHSIFMIIKEDWQTLARNLDLIENKTLKKYKNMAEMKYDFDFLKAIYEKNEKGISDALNGLTDKAVHKKRNDNGVINQYLSFPAAGYAKLAWLKGMEVEIKSPLIPRELLIVEPLKEYKDNYRFVQQYLDSR